MSGRNVTDHSHPSLPSKKGGASTLPEGSKTTMMKSPVGAGRMGSDYPDTEADIYRDQESSVRKIHKGKMRNGERNEIGK